MNSLNPNLAYPQHPSRMGSVSNSNPARLRACRLLAPASAYAVTKLIITAPQQHHRAQVYDVPFRELPPLDVTTQQGIGAVMAEAVCQSTPGPLHSLRSRVGGMTASLTASAL